MSNWMDKEVTVFEKYSWEANQNVNAQMNYSKTRKKKDAAL